MDQLKPLELANGEDDYLAAVQQVRDQVLALQRQHREQQPYWVVMTDQTSDAPGAFLARLWLCFGSPTPVATKNLVRAASLREIRNLLPRGMAVLPRLPADDPVIVEVWV